MPDKPKVETSLSPLMVLLGGLGLGIGFLPLPLWCIAWVALVPLLWIWDHVTSVTRFLAEIFTAFLIAYALGFFWPLLHLFSKTPWVAVGSLLAVPALWTLPFAASLPFRRRGLRAGFAALVIFFLAVDMAFLNGPLPFPWPLLGHTQAAAVPLVQFVEVTGEIGLTLWVLILNGLFFAMVAQPRRWQRWAIALVIAGVLLSSIALGQWRRFQLNRTARHVTVGLVQPSLTPEAWNEQYGAARLRRLTALSDSLIAVMNAPPVFFIWPEMALPAPINDARQRFVTHALQAWTERRQVALLTGALYPVGDPSATTRYFNSAVLFSPAAPPQRYDQVHLLPFQYGVTLREQAPWLPTRLNPRFAPGKAPHTLRFDALHLGILLDFELLLGDYARQHARRQADFFVALSRDGWWRRTPGFGHHLRHARLRSLETRRSVALVTASGSTALIGPDGAVIFRSQQDVPVARLAAVPLQQGLTIYTRAGGWLGWIAVAVAMLLALGLLLSGLWYTIKAPEHPLPSPRPPIA